jgi:hypothetical protein
MWKNSQSAAENAQHFTPQFQKGAPPPSPRAGVFINTILLLSQASRRKMLRIYRRLACFFLAHILA